MEVLITLGTIGVVAALTMPSLIAKHQEKVAVAKLKKMYSIISQAHLQAVAQNGPVNEWGLIGRNSPEGVLNFFDNISPYLKIVRDCGLGQGCFPDVVYKFLRNTSDVNVDLSNGRTKTILADGTSMLTHISNADCALTNTECASICLDINGLKPPNQWGIDFFCFHVTPERVLPFGYDTTVPLNCNKTGSGTHCAAWVIYNENMDYLHCNDLSWGGKTKCD